MHYGKWAVSKFLQGTSAHSTLSGPGKWNGAGEVKIAFIIARKEIM